MGEVFEFEHKTWSFTALITGTGFTVISNVSGTPLQVTPAFVYVGLTVINPYCAIGEVFTLVNDIPEPNPLAPIPKLTLLEVQL